VVVTRNDGKLALGRIGALCEQVSPSSSHMLQLVVSAIMGSLLLSSLTCGLRERDRNDDALECRSTLNRHHRAIVTLEIH